MVKVETLQTILGNPRSNSGFYPEPDSRAGKEMGNKPGNMPDSLHGKTIWLIKKKNPFLCITELQSNQFGASYSS